jgi:enoyl-CoA hydratase/carnithine racemase
VTSSTVGFERNHHTLLITLQRAHKRNAVDRQLADELDAALHQLDADPELWVGLLCADGPAFSAGSDLAASGDYVTVDGGEYGIIRRPRTKPLIAVVEGSALGGGFEIVLACDLVVASTDARFGLPEVRRGLVPACAALFRAPRALPLNLARELILTGEPIDARRAYDAGLVNTLVEPGRARAAAAELAALICRNGPLAVRACLKAINELAANDDQLGWVATERAKSMTASSADRAEGVAAFLEKRAPKWTGR